MTTPHSDLMDARVSRRAFGQRAARWSLAGTVALIAAACGGSAATKEEAAADLLPFTRVFLRAYNAVDIYSR